MLRNIKDIENYTSRATDGPIGLVNEVYFDDDAWLTTNATTILIRR